MLSPEEIEALLRACQSSRDRAIIALLYESGCRIGELGRLTWRRVQFDAYGIVVSIEDTKCHTQRYVRLVMATPYLATWKNDYPFEPTGDALVFITYRKKPLQHATVYQQFHKIAKRAGVTKKITPHIFRHSRITHLINQGMKESVIKLMMWGNLNTDMFASLPPTSPARTSTEKFSGSTASSSRRKRRSSTQNRCSAPACKTINVPRANYCTTCGRPFTGDREDVQEAMGKDVIDNPGARAELLNELIEEKKRKGENRCSPPVLRGAIFIISSPQVRSGGEQSPYDGSGTTRGEEQFRRSTRRSAPAAPGTVRRDEDRHLRVDRPR